MTKRLSFLLLLVAFALALAACGGKDAEPAAQAPVATSPPGQAAPPTAAPTAQPKPQVRADVPIMADAANITVASTADGYSVTYTSSGDIETAASFYQTQMPALGWLYQANISSQVGDVSKVLAFAKGNEEAAVTLSAAGAATQVIVAISPQATVAQPTTPPAATVQPTTPPATSPPPTPPPPTPTSAPAVQPTSPPAAGESNPATDIPLTSDATGVTTVTQGEEQVITYNSAMAVDAIAEFYKAEMPPRGWSFDASISSQLAGVNATLHFTQADAEATVTLTTLGLGTQVVIAVTGAASNIETPPTPTPAPPAQATSPPPTQPPPPPTQAPAPTQPPATSGPRDDIPFMPDAVDLDVSAGGGDYTATYNSPSGLDAVMNFYQAEMPPRGWTYLADDTAYVPGVTATLYFVKGGDKVSVTLTNRGGVTAVQIDLK